MVSGSVSLPSSGCFSPFPHGTGSLSVSREYLALPDGPGGFAQDYSCPALLRIPLGHATLRVRGSHPLRPDFPDSSARVLCAMAWSYYPDAALLQRRFGLFPGRSPLLGESLLFSLPRGTKMFQFPRFASSHVVMMTVLQTAGLSHSEIRGSKVICTLPRLIAAYHVLHRLREPRHPPCALIHFLGSAISLYFKWTATHTFSCVHSIIYTSLYFLEFHSTVSCVNMSKISCPYKGMWRISGSNR